MDLKGPGPTISTSQFRHGNDHIIGGGILANEFVPTPASAQRCLHKSRRVMWGAVAKSRGNWIDSAEQEDLQLGVRIPDRILDQSLSSCGMERLEDLSSGGVSYDFIVEGVVQEASSTAPYVRLESPDHLAVLHGP